MVEENQETKTAEEWEKYEKQGGEKMTYEDYKKMKTKRKLQGMAEKITNDLAQIGEFAFEGVKNVGKNQYDEFQKQQSGAFGGDTSIFEPPKEKRHRATKKRRK